MDSDSSDKENDDVAEFPEVSDEVPANYLASRKGKKLLLDPYNYLYEKEKELEDGKCRWRCQRKRSKIYPRYDWIIILALKSYQFYPNQFNAIAFYLTRKMAHKMRQFSLLTCRVWS
jgi:hypothetical protein